MLGGEDLLNFAEITVFKELLKHLLVVPSWLHCNQIRVPVHYMVQFVVGYKVGSLLLTAVNFQLMKQQKPAVN